MVALDDPVDRGSGLRVHFSEIFAGTRRHLASATGFTCNPSLPPDSRSEPVFSRMAILPWFDNSGCTQTLPASSPSSLRRSCPSDRIIAGYLLESHLLGRDSMNVYLEEIQSGEEKEELKKKLRWISLKLGWFPMLMAFIPIVGWLMLPMLMVMIVIGLTSLLERARQ